MGGSQQPAGRSLLLPCRYQHRSARCGVSFDRVAVILRVEEVFQRLKGHLAGAALLVWLGVGLIDDAYIGETAALKPMGEGFGGGQKK
ncbi:hypothetical protein R84865_002533 [Carnimonas sp. R-84865]